MLLRRQWVWCAMVGLLAMTHIESGRAQDTPQRQRDRFFEGRRDRPRNNDQPRPPRDPEFPAIDGTGNNEANPAWGTTNADLLRKAAPSYADGISTVDNDNRVSARVISNAVFAQSESIPNAARMSDMMWQWGQFLDHDIDLTHLATPPEELPIAIPTGDPFFDPDGEGGATFPFFRAVFNTDTGTSTENPRQQVNNITAFIDGSNVYGSDDATAEALREFEGGRLKTSTGDLLPTNEAGFFLAGDIRVNEQVYLTAMHTLFMREHNRIAGKLAKEHPNWTDEQLYQHSRRLVTASLQVITYKEFLPALLGEGGIPKYREYNPEVNPGIANVFSTAGYRFGHSMLSSTLLRLDPKGKVIPAGNLSLREAFFNPDLIKDEGISPYMMGLIHQQAQEIDTKVVDDVRNFLFGSPGDGGLDLPSFNIQRGRDHGLPDYNTVRAAYGLPVADGFDDITSKVEVQAALFAAYGNVSNVDVWVGCLAEDHPKGSNVGPLVSAIMKDQFTRLRDGDRFWYTRVLTRSEREAVEATRLSDIIERNTLLRDLPGDVFHVPKSSRQRR